MEVHKDTEHEPSDETTIPVSNEGTEAKKLAINGNLTMSTVEVPLKEHNTDSTATGVIGKGVTIRVPAGLALNHAACYVLRDAPAACIQKQCITPVVAF